MFNVDFKDALKIIEQDFNLPTKVRTKASAYFGSQGKLSDQKIKDFDYLKGDIEPFLWYWEQFGICQDTLERYNVEFALEVYLGDFTWDISTPDDPIFVYNFPSGRKKFYKPLTNNKKKKFYGSATCEDTNGWDQLDDYKTSKLVIITKSMKDVMVLHELGINAVAPQGEMQLLSEIEIEFLKSKYGEVILLFDNDGLFHPPPRTSGKGKEATKKYVNKFDIPYTFIPERYESKDTSDFVRDHCLIGDRDLAAFHLWEFISQKKTIIPPND